MRPTFLITIINVAAIQTLWEEKSLISNIFHHGSSFCSMNIQHFKGEKVSSKGKQLGKGSKK